MHRLSSDLKLLRKQITSHSTSDKIMDLCLTIICWRNRRPKGRNADILGQCRSIGNSLAVPSTAVHLSYKTLLTPLQLWNQNTKHVSALSSTLLFLSPWVIPSGHISQLQNPVPVSLSTLLIPSLVSSSSYRLNTVIITLLPDPLTVEVSLE